MGVENQLGELIVKIIGDASALKAALAESEVASRTTGQKIEANMSKIGSTATAVGAGLSVAFTVPLALIAAQSTKTFGSVEQSLDQMVGLVGISRSQVQAWGNDFIKLGPQLGQTPQQLADAMFYITSAGLRGTDAMDALVASSKAAAGGLGEVKTVANAATSAMNAYGAENLSASGATDILVATVREGKLEAADLAAEIGTVIPTAHAMGVTFNEVGVGIASLTRIGFNTAEAVTSLNQVFSAFLKPSSDAEKTLAEFGLTAAGVRQEIKSKGLIATLQDLQTKIKGNDATLAKIVPNVRALRGVLGLFGDNAKNTIGIMERMNDVAGSTDKAFGAIADSIQFKQKQALAALGGAFTKIGEDLARDLVPIIEDITKKLEEFTDWWNSLDRSTKEFIITMAAFTAAAGPAALAIGVISKALAFMAANPVVAVIGGIAAITAGLIALKKASDVKQLNDGLANVSDRLKDGAKNGEDIVTNITEVSRQTGLSVKQVANLADQAHLVSEEMRAQVDALVTANAEQDKQKAKTVDIIKQNQTMKDLIGTAANSGADMAQIVTNASASWGVSLDRVISIAKSLDNLSSAQKDQLSNLQKQLDIENKQNSAEAERWKQTQNQNKYLETSVQKQKEITAELQKQSDIEAKRVAGVIKDRAKAEKDYKDAITQTNGELASRLITQAEAQSQLHDATKKFAQDLLKLGYDGKLTIKEWTDENGKLTKGIQQGDKELNTALSDLIKYQDALNAGADQLAHAEKSSYQQIAEFREIDKKNFADNELEKQTVEKAALDKRISEYRSFGSTVTSIMSPVFESLGSALIGTQDGWKDLGKTAIHAVAQIIRSLAAQLSAQATLDLATLNFPGAALATAGVVSLYAAAGAVDALANGFATGGDFIVPPGYPNDSYPIRVSSGEHVTITPANESGSSQQTIVVKLNEKTLLSAIGKASKNGKLIISAKGVQ